MRTPVSVQLGSVHFQGWPGRQELAETVTETAAERLAALLLGVGL